MPEFRYISNARTLEELRDDFLSDLKRRLDTIDAHINRETQKQRKAALATARQEVEDIANFWRQVELKQRKRKESDASAT